MFAVVITYSESSPQVCVGLTNDKEKAFVKAAKVMDSKIRSNIVKRFPSFRVEVYSRGTLRGGFYHEPDGTVESVYAKKYDELLSMEFDIDDFEFGYIALSSLNNSGKISDTPTRFIACAPSIDELKYNVCNRLAWDENVKANGNIAAFRSCGSKDGNESFELECVIDL